MRISETISKLEEFVRLGFVLHGSPCRVASLEPRQSHNNGEPDGAPAVFATHYPELAFIYAICRGLEGRVIIGAKLDKVEDPLHNICIYLKPCPTMLRSLRTIQKQGFRGYVHVLDLNVNQYVHAGPSEVRISKTVRPVATIGVSIFDFPFDLSAEKVEYAIVRKRWDPVRFT